MSETGREGERVETLVVGAGPAGLAVGACLRAAGLPFLMIERSDRVGAAWHRHYERLHLHTAKRHSGLPFMPFPDDHPQYPSRLQVVEYLDAYAARFELKPRFGEEVVSARRVESDWEVRTSSGASFACEHLVIATGYNRAPHAPRWNGQEKFGGTLIHSSEYRNGAPFRGKRVLVVGIGNTGGEIAIDLVEHGAAETCISVRSPVNVVPRDFLGRPTQVTGIMLSWLPTRIMDKVGAFASWWTFGDLSDVGLRRPAYGAATQIERFGRIPLIDVGTIGLLRRRVLTIVPDVARFKEGGAEFTDGSERVLDAVILATGYKPKLDYIEGIERATDERGYPRALEGGEALPGAYFAGYVNARTGFLREIAKDARAIAAAIARARGPRQRKTVG